MLAVWFDELDFPHWITWVSVAAGALASSVVIGSAVVYGRWRSRGGTSREEDLPWQDLLQLLLKRNRERAAANLPPEELTEEVLDQLVKALPSVVKRQSLEAWDWEDLRDHDERRSGPRRWGNSTEVHLYSSHWVGHLHGLVVNRSTGGLGIFADQYVSRGISLNIRAVEAPITVPAIWAKVRHCRKAGNGFLLGCEFRGRVPRNVRVWFG
jgi:hypothetical protein